MITINEDAFALFAFGTRAVEYDEFTKLLSYLEATLENSGIPTAYVRKCSLVSRAFCNRAA